MSGRTLAAFLVLLMLGAGLVVTPSASAEMEAPTLSARPALDADIGSTEWGVSESFSFDAPRVSGSSTVRMGYLDGTEELVMGFVLSDETDQNNDKLTVWIAPRRVESGDGTEDQDMRIEIEADGSWELYHGNEQNDTIGFETGADQSGSTATSATDPLSFATDRTAASWIVEMAVDIGSFQAGEPIQVGFQQTDVNAQDDEKTSKRPSDLDEAKPATWERTVLSGRPSSVQLQLSPPNMEAGVGGDVIVTLPSDASGGRLTVSVKAPGESGFTPIGTRSPGDPGRNVFFFAPESVGTYQIRANWEGDEDYQRREIGPRSVEVAKPTPAGPTVLETGSMRVAFPLENAHAPAEWTYINTRVWATNDAGETLDLVRLDSSNSCRNEPWVGFVNPGGGGIQLHFDPPVRRAAIALTSPQDAFTANWKGYQSDGELKEEATGQGNCGQPVFASVGDIEDDIERIEISYTGDDTREVVDVAFAHPLQTTAPQVTARSIPSPLHQAGAATIQAAAGSPHGIVKSKVEVRSGSQALAATTCNRPAGQVWIDCSVDAKIPAGAGAIQVKVTSTDQFGSTYTDTRTLVTQADNIPPQASLLPRPMVAAPGGAVAVDAKATDGSGIDRIYVEAHRKDGQILDNRTCVASGLKTTFACTLSLSPPDQGTAYVTASYTDEAGNNATVGPKPVAVRGPDDDGDDLPNELEAEIGTSAAQPDTDGDGLPDGWETIGVDRSGDGQPELDLPALGADPQVKDVFVEFDWAEHDGHSHEVSYAAIQLVRNVLSAQGIRLHTDIAEQGGPFDPTRFDHGHEAHRHLIDPARAGIFMHVLSGHMGGPAAGGGWTIYLPTPPTEEQNPSRVGAQLLHEIGHHLGLGHGGGGTVDADGGTKQAAYAEDYKPNYLSTMNNAYAWGIFVDTTDGVVRVPSLSGLEIGDLDEASLDEPAGISFDIPALRDTLRAGPTHVIPEDVITGLRMRYTCPNEGPVRWTLVPGPVDWNCNGASGDRGVNANVNRGGANSGHSTLYSRSDWDALSFQGAACPHYALMLTDDEDTPADTEDHGGLYGPLGLAPCPLHAEPATPLDADVSASVTEPGTPSGPLEEADRRDNDDDGQVDDGFADTDGDGVVNLIDDCPTVANGAQVDQDRDGRGDSCQAPPARVTDVTATATGAGVQLSWPQVFHAWGYNVYRLAGDNVTQLGGGSPSTTSAGFTDAGGSTGTRYMVRAVGTLADQGPPTTVVAAAGTGDDGGDGGPGDNGSGTPEQSVPGAGVLAGLVTVSVAALLDVKRRSRSR